MNELKQSIVTAKTKSPVSFEVLTIEKGQYQVIVLPCFDEVPEEAYPVFLAQTKKKEEALKIHHNVVKILQVNPGYMNICAALSAISLQQDEVFIHESLRNPIFHQPQLKN